MVRFEGVDINLDVPHDCDLMSLDEFIVNVNELLRNMKDLLQLWWWLRVVKMLPWVVMHLLRVVMPLRLVGCPPARQATLTTGVSSATCSFGSAGTSPTPRTVQSRFEAARVRVIAFLDLAKEIQKKATCELEDQPEKSSMKL
eukprot:s1137_g10.t1